MNETNKTRRPDVAGWEDGTIATSSKKSRSWLATVLIIAVEFIFEIFG